MPLLVSVTKKHHVVIIETEGESSSSESIEYVPKKKAKLEKKEKPPKESKRHKTKKKYVKVVNENSSSDAEDVKEIVTHSWSSSSNRNVQGCAKLTEFPCETSSPVKSQETSLPIYQERCRCYH